MGAIRPIVRLGKLPDWPDCNFFHDYPIEPSEPWVPDWPDWKPEPDWTDWSLGEGPGLDGVYVQVDFQLVHLMVGTLFFWGLDLSTCSDVSSLV